MGEAKDELQAQKAARSEAEKSFADVKSLADAVGKQYKRLDALSLSS